MIIQAAFLDKTDNKETLVIATHGFLKKVDKVPANEIDRALRLRDKYFNSKQKKVIIWQPKN